MVKRIIIILGIVFLCENCTVATKHYVSTELTRQRKEIESSNRVLDSLLVRYRTQIDSNKIALDRLEGQQRTLKTSALALDSLLTDYQTQIDSNSVRLVRLLSAYTNLQSEMQVVRKIDIPNLQTRDQQFESITENLNARLETLTRQSLQELADLIETYLQQTDSLQVPETLGTPPVGTDENPPAGQPDPVVPQ